MCIRLYAVLPVPDQHHQGAPKHEVVRSILGDVFVKSYRWSTNDLSARTFQTSLKKLCLQPIANSRDGSFVPTPLLESLSSVLLAIPPGSRFNTVVGENDIRFSFAYTGTMSARLCEVSFVDVSGIRHSVEVTAGSLYEAIALGLGDLRKAGLTPVMPGPATAITVRVKAAAETEHTIPFRQFENWLSGTARSPKERLTKDRLRELSGEAQ